MAKFFCLFKINQEYLSGIRIGIQIFKTGSEDTDLKKWDPQHWSVLSSVLSLLLGNITGQQRNHYIRPKPNLSLQPRIGNRSNNILVGIFTPVVTQFSYCIYLLIYVVSINPCYSLIMLTRKLSLLWFYNGVYVFSINPSAN